MLVLCRDDVRSFVALIIIRRCDPSLGYTVYRQLIFMHLTVRSWDIFQYGKAKPEKKLMQCTVKIYIIVIIVFSYSHSLKMISWGLSRGK